MVLAAVSLLSVAFGSAHKLAPDGERQQRRL
jgi:hypothetical protein